jgi:type I restriction enzyme, S subunit
MNKTRKSTMNSQLPDGYKQTEIGIIPEDWEVKRLKNISPSQSVGLVINPSSYFDSNGSVPMLVGSHINENGIDWESANRISNVSNNLLPSSRLAAGDLVTVRVGDPGLTAVVPSELDGCNCASMMIVRQHRSFDSCWLCYVMNSPFGRSQIEHVQYGTAQKQFNISDAVDFLYPVPLLNEQKAIAHALSDIDALIESLDRLLTKKRQIKQGAMQELLTGRKRLPEFDKGQGYKKTEIGIIPEDWNVVSMGSIGESLIGLTYSPFDVREFGSLVLRSSNIQNEKLTFYDNVYVEMDLPERVITKENDILICVRNGSKQLIGKCVLIDQKTAGSAFGAFMSVYRSDHGEFLLFQFQSNIIKRQINEAMGATINQITNKDLAGFQVIFPPNKAEQDEITTILSDMDAEIDSIEAKLTKTRQIKQGMMHELLTGRIRLI